MWHSISADEAMNKLCTDKNGISDYIAAERLKTYGKNEIEPPKKDSIFKKFLAQFSDYMIIILLAAAGVSFVISLISGEVFVSCVTFGAGKNASAPGQIEMAKLEEILEVLSLS